MKKFEDLTFTDHYMFEKVLKNPEICKELLERLLKIQIERLEYPEVEKTISPYYETKGVRLDVYVKDNNKVFDIELQNSTDLNLGLRTRYYQSMLDTDNLLKGQHYTELPDSYIVFICKNDPFEKELPIYTFQTVCIENPNLTIKDNAIKKIFNAKAYNKEEDVAIKSFLQYINNNKTVDDFTQRLDSFVNKIKQEEVNRKEYQSMNIHDQDTFLRGKNEGFEAGMQQGIQQKAIETTKNMFAKNIPLKIIAECTGLPLETIENLAKELLVKN
ncbi:MAG: Rpn family recombination-promoting nuclease/putative transposase [Treponemataceae bacterium]|nr:Rpn family recombination-promoting nuclease/putative transposase [Treponemataceae bacterium]